MSERRHTWPPGRYLPLLVTRLHRETAGMSGRTLDFGVLCDIVGIPRTARVGLLEALVSQGYATLGRGQELLPDGGGGQTGRRRAQVKGVRR